MGLNFTEIKFHMDNFCGFYVFVNPQNLLSMQKVKMSLIWFSAWTKLNPNEFMQSADTPTKLLNKLHDFFSDLIYKDPNKCTKEE